MDHVVLSSDDFDRLARASEPVTVHDEQGRVRGFITLVIDSQELAEAKQALASNARRYTTAEVLAHLRGRDES